MAEGFKLAIAGILCVLLLGGSYDHVYNIEPNKCLMTYMFEYPQYIPVTLPAYVQRLFPRYNLFSYGEGNFSQFLRDGHYEGIPILFIPGNGGSYKQVRSLASVAYRKALDDDTDFHFNFFTVDLNEELGAFYGPALERQTEFVTYAVREILKLYDKTIKKPESIVLVGHSMGGMIARALHVTQNVSSSTLPLIITQATPHTRPVVVADYHLKNFYEKVNYYWEDERSSTLKDIVLVTVGGGRNDIQVATSHINTPFADIATTTSNVPSCWLTTDHQAIVWCKQLVMAIVRSLFDIVDISTRQITTNRKLIVDVFEFHLAKRITGKRYKRATYSAEVIFDKDGDWKEIIKRQYTHVANTTEQNTYLMIPLNPNHQQYHDATIVASNLSKKDWVMACKAEHVKHNTKICLEGLNLSQKTKKLFGKVKAVQLDLASLSSDGYTDIVVYIAPTDERVEVSIDVHSENGRHRSVEVPVFIRSFTQTLIVDTTPQKALSYNVSLIGLQEPWQSFRFTLRPRQTCLRQSVIAAKIYMPWAQKESYLQRSGQVVSFSAELDLPPPPDDNSSASIQFFLNPECTYSVIIQGSLLGVFRRLVWLYGAQIPTYCAVHLLLTLSKQLKTIGDESRCPSFFSAIISLSPITVVPAAKIINVVFTNVDISDDFTVMSNNGEHLGILPILLFLGTLPITLAVGMMTWGMVILTGNAAHSFAVKLLGRRVGGEVVGEMAASGLSRVPVIVGVALISLAYSTCGTFGLCLSASFYFIQVYKMYEDYLKNFLVGLIPGVNKEESNNSKALSSVHLHITLMLLVLLVAAFNIPALIIWGRSLSHNLQLQEDPSLAVTIAVLITLCFLWQKNIPQVDRNYYKYLSYAVHAIAVFTLLFGSVHIYRVSYFVTLAIALVALHQLLAPAKPLVTPILNHGPSDNSNSGSSLDQSGTDTIGTDTMGTNTMGTGTMGTGTMGTSTMGTGTMGTGTMGTSTMGTGTMGTSTMGTSTMGTDTIGIDTQNQGTSTVCSQHDY